MRKSVLVFSNLGSNSKLIPYDMGHSISKELDVAFGKKKESAAAFRAANDKFCTSFLFPSCEAGTH
jgi:hypothetical protein